jgi:hypothetical protein
VSTAELQDEAARVNEQTRRAESSSAIKPKLQLKLVDPSSRAGRRALAQRTAVPASGQTIYTSTCFSAIYPVAGTPPAPASGNPFAVAGLGTDPLSNEYLGYLQADGTINGQAQSETSPIGQVEFATGFTWPASYPASSSVSITARPAWNGGIGVLSTNWELTFSTGTGAFAAGQEIYDSTIAHADNAAIMGSAYESASDGGEHNYFFQHGPADGAYTIGDNLTPGQTYAYIDYAQVQQQAQAGALAPAGAVVDFGSLGLQTPANMVDSSGDPIGGYYMPGPDPSDPAGRNTFELTFKVPDKIVICNDLTAD